MPVANVVQRREAKIAAIVEAAWGLARVNGIQAVSLHALAKVVGMRQPSLYVYFDSKHALYDAMFADGNRHLLERLERLGLPDDPRDAVKSCMRAFAEFALEDDARAQLLFQRPIAGFEPTPASYAYAEKVMSFVVELLAAAGLDDPGDVDCFVAMVAGLIAAQVSNDPGGDRWINLIDRAVDLLLD